MQRNFFDFIGIERLSTRIALYCGDHAGDLSALEAKLNYKINTQSHNYFSHSLNKSHGEILNAIELDITLILMEHFREKIIRGHVPLNLGPQLFDRECTISNYEEVEKFRDYQDILMKTPIEFTSLTLDYNSLFTAIMCSMYDGRALSARYKSTAQASKSTVSVYDLYRTCTSARSVDYPIPKEQRSVEISLPINVFKIISGDNARWLGVPIKYSSDNTDACLYVSDESDIDISIRTFPTPHEAVFDTLLKLNIEEKPMTIWNMKSTSGGYLCTAAQLAQTVSETVSTNLFNQVRKADKGFNQWAKIFRPLSLFGINVV